MKIILFISVYASLAVGVYSELDKNEISDDVEINESSRNHEEHGTDRLLGSSNANILNFPYMASLRRGRTGHFCGGSIVNSKYVLTAAHCVVDLNQNDFNVMLVAVGTGNLYGQDGWYYTVQQVTWLNYNKAKRHNDVGFVRIHTNFVFNNFVRPIAFDNNFYSGGVRVKIVGFGARSYQGPNRQILQQLDLTTITNLQCKFTYTDNIDNGNICTAGGGGYGACSGDSGGPLTINGRQVGIDSFGRNCGTNPDVFVRTAQYYKDIMEHTRI